MFYLRGTAMHSRVGSGANAQFNLLCIVGHARYPVYFERQSFRYELQVCEAGDP
jgi:hypothetical protein